MRDNTPGLHLILTGFVRPEQNDLNDPQKIAGLLKTCVDLVQMVPLTEPVIKEVPLEESLSDSDADCGGVTGFIILGTSHVSIHTWPQHARFSFDLYSCHSFNANLILSYLKESLSMTGADVILLDRTPNTACRNSFQERHA